MSVPQLVFQCVDHAQEEYMPRHTLLSQPLRQCVSLALVGDIPSTALIRLLVGTRGPSAVLGRVWTVVVHTFQGMPLRAFSHVREEGAEVVAPSDAHRNASPTIVRVGSAVRVITSRLRRTPGPILRRRAHPVRREPAPGGLPDQAPAATSDAAHDVIGINRTLGATIAHARGDWTPTQLLGNAGDDQSAKALTDDAVINHMTWGT